MHENTQRMLERLAEVSPEGHAMTIHVVTPENYWPLPWYLRRFEQVGWWSAPPADPYAPVVIASSKLQLALDEPTSDLDPRGRREFKALLRDQPAAGSPAIAARPPT